MIKETKYSKKQLLRHLIKGWCTKERANSAIESNYDFVCRAYQDENIKTIANIIRSLWVN